MGHKGHYGEYTGNARHSKVTSSNMGATKRDDEAHMTYLKEDINYDSKHGGSDSSMTSDEKHISKLAGDLKYDEKKHGSAAKMVSPVKQVMDPSLAQQPQSLMSNVPPQQANTMGQAQPVFSPQTQQVAQGMFGSTQSMQNSVGATPLFQVQELPAVDLGTVKSDYKDKAFGLPFPGDKMYKGTDGFGKYGGKYTKEMTDANSNYTRQHNLANKPGYAEMKQNQLQEEASVVKTEDEGMSNMLQRQENERRSIMEQTELSDRTELSED